MLSWRKPLPPAWTPAFAQVCDTGSYVENDLFVDRIGVVVGIARVGAKATDSRFEKSREQAVLRIGPILFG